MARVGRRRFLGMVSTGGAVMSLGSATVVIKGAASAEGKPALLGGKPVRASAFPGWPVIGENDREHWKKVLEKGIWNRGPEVRRFEDSWARLLGAKFAVATASGTAALYSCLAALDVGPGDEVLLPPYTFVATVNVVLLHHALPVFVDSDRRTFQMDASKLEASVNPQTRCIIPVHLGGNVVDLDSVMGVADRRGIPVLEDACQAHLAEWRGKKVGTIGRLGCFSFQATKNLNCGEGGAIVSNHAESVKLAASFHNAGRPYAVDEGKLDIDTRSDFSYARNGDNRRLTEFQGTLLCEQMVRLDEQARTREQNAGYLTAQLKEIPGIAPAEEYPGCTRNAFHLYMFRYDPAQFSGLARNRFLQALEAEGIPALSGYTPLNLEPFISRVVKSRGYRKIYSDQEIRHWEERNRCPENDQLCKEAVWLTQTQLLGPRSDMDEIAAAIRKIRKYAGELGA